MNVKQSSPIFEDFLQSYLEKDAGISDKDWLKEKLKQESLNLTDEALENWQPVWDILLHWENSVYT